MRATPGVTRIETRNGQARVSLTSMLPRVALL